MNRKWIGSLILGCAFVFGAGIARAQKAPPPPPDAMMHPGGPDGDLMYGPIGERMELLGFAGMQSGKVVTGAPFSAVAVSETTQTLADGNHISRKTQTNLFRDSQGRVRKEVTLSGFGPLAASRQPKSFVFINDPVAGRNFILHPDQKTAEQMGKDFGRMKGAMKGELSNRMGRREQVEADNLNLKKEDLGTQTIGGVAAQGTRITRAIPAGQIGNEKPITVVRESWYSNDLQTVVMSKRSDPWSGETTYTLTNIQRAEPDASLFAVPSNYTVTQGRPGRHGLMRRNQAPPPPSDN
ncbi:MAG: hypothetical protein AUH86_02605 [Acidobacteria bacterium 13_1_40CM_4_58_4]|nr:MAG: hypothetical protein AUH86_02605 [Acidobacteria bacterium 13_1_40CM_4_58_4]